MKVTAFQLLLFVQTLLILTTIGFPISKRGSGFDRLRDRLYRRRHRQQKTAVPIEDDEMFEMEVGRVRAEKSVHHHHHHHRNKHKSSKVSGSRRERNENLCQTDRTTVELNTPSHEFDPPFLVETRCLNVALAHGEEHTCVKGMLRCVQQSSDVHVSRRAVGSMHWHPYTIAQVPTACECMWPADKYGHQEF